jgi:hypothetical protein
VFTFVVQLAVTRRGVNSVNSEPNMNMNTNRELGTEKREGL